MSDNRPTPIDEFLVRNGFLPSTPLTDVVAQQPPPPTPSPNRHGPSGRYFINEQQLDGRPRTTVTPAGTSQFAEVEDPMPDRVTFESEMAARTELAREVERQNRMSGSHTISGAKLRARQGWEPYMVRGAGGVLRADWRRVGSYLEHDDAGRIHPTTSVDRGWVPGGDFV